MDKKFDQIGIVLLVGGILWSAVLLAALGWYAGIRFSEIIHFSFLLLREMGLLSFFLFSALGYGLLILNILGLRDKYSDLYYCLAVVLGLGVLGHLTLALGVLKLLYQSAALILLGAGTLIAILKMYHSRDRLKQVMFPHQITLFSVLLVALLILNNLYPLLADALVPPTWWDEVAYHLAVPKIYIQNHALVYISFIPYSNWPMEAEILFTLGLLLRSELLPHLIEWSAMVFTCWGLYLLGKRLFSAEIGLLAAVLFSTTPMVLSLAGTALIEPSLTLFTFFAVLCFIEWVETQEDKYKVLSAWLGGLAASTKLNAALVAVFIGFLAAAFILSRTKSIKAAGMQLLTMGSISFSIVLPWYIKNWSYTGNPFWPFLLEIFGGRNWDALGSEYLLGFIRKPNLALTLPNYILSFWYLAFEPLRFGSFQVALGRLYLILLPLTFPAMFLGKPLFRRRLGLIVLITGIFYTSWFFQTHQSRFLMPATPFLAILAAAGIGWVVSLFKERYSGLIQGGVILMLIGGVWGLDPAARARISTRWEFLSGRITREEFLTTQIPGYAAFSYANNYLPDNAYVLLSLYESRGYYLDRRYAWANPISQRFLPFEQFANAESLGAALRAQGFTHILFRPVGLERFTYIRYGAQITQLMQALLDKEARLVYATSDLELYELVNYSSEK